MKLYIDTSNADKVIVGLGGKKYEADSRREKAQMVLPFIVKILKRQNKKIEDVDQIEVNAGPGSFTGLRVGLAVANTIGWLLNVPVNGKNVRKEGPLVPNYN